LDGAVQHFLALHNFVAHGIDCRTDIACLPCRFYKQHREPANRTIPLVDFAASLRVAPDNMRVPRARMFDALLFE
jgi:hypothetical protein